MSIVKPSLRKGGSRPYIVYNYVTEENSTIHLQLATTSKKDETLAQTLEIPKTLTARIDEAYSGTIPEKGAIHIVIPTSAVPHMVKAKQYWAHYQVPLPKKTYTSGELLLEHEDWVKLARATAFLEVVTKGASLIQEHIEKFLNENLSLNEVSKRIKLCSDWVTVEKETYSKINEGKLEVGKKDALTEILESIPEDDLKEC